MITAIYPGSFDPITNGHASILKAGLVSFDRIVVAVLNNERKAPLFSVAERTRQIGTRRAIGARRRDILAYFLTETSLVTVLGITIGIALAYGLNMLLMNLTGGSKIGLGELVFAVVGIWLIGLTATYFPARRGAAVPPVIATRSV